MQCDNCGRQLADGATFCTSCGWKTDNWHREVKHNKSMHMSLIIALILSLAVLICLLFLLTNTINNYNF